jgi:glycerol-3-phosphate acyltransferase PlsY
VPTGGYIVVALLAYLLGSIPTGYLVARARGIDIRTVGSGNIGATNVFRYMGVPAGIFVLLADALKGWLAVILIARLVSAWFSVQPTDQAREWMDIIAGISAILGHNFTCWLHFKGGKGIATSAGVLAALVPWALLIILAIWGLVLGLTRYVSLASIIAAAALPFAAWLTRAAPAAVGMSAVMGLLAIYKHRANIKRLLSGTENRIGSKKAKAPGAGAPV